MIPEGILALFAAMLCSLRLGDGGSFPKPLSREEEQRCLTLAARALGCTQSAVSHRRGTS